MITALELVQSARNGIHSAEAQLAIAKDHLDRALAMLREERAREEANDGELLNQTNGD